jgi:hypothetical protein
MKLVPKQAQVGATLSSLNLCSIGISLDPLWLIASFRRNRRHAGSKRDLFSIRLYAALPFGEIDIVIGMHRLSSSHLINFRGVTSCVMMIWIMHAVGSHRRHTTERMVLISAMQQFWRKICQAHRARQAPCSDKGSLM